MFRIGKWHKYLASCPTCWLTLFLKHPYRVLFLYKIFISKFCKQERLKIGKHIQICIRYAQPRGKNSLLKEILLCTAFLKYWHLHSVWFEEGWCSFEAGIKKNSCIWIQLLQICVTGSNISKYILNLSFFSVAGQGWLNKQNSLQFKVFRSLQSNSLPSCVYLYLAATPPPTKELHFLNTFLWGIIL